MNLNLSLLLVLLIIIPLESSWEEFQLSNRQGRENGEFGIAVGIYNQTVIIGSKRDFELTENSGAAYIYRKKDESNWKFEQKLLPNDPEDYSWFGFDVQIYDSVAVVQAAQKDDKEIKDVGAVYIYELQNSGVWEESRKISGGDFERNWFFGKSCVLEEDILIVTSLKDIKENGALISICHVFVRDNNGDWNFARTLYPEILDHNTNFGISIDMFENRIVIGATGDPNSLDEQGVVYVFKRLNNGNWVKEAKLTASSLGRNKMFGYNIAIGSQSIVTSKGNEICIFNKNNDGYRDSSESYKIELESGRSISNLRISENELVVSTEFSGKLSENKIYVYNYSAINGWERVGKILSSEKSKYDWFGRSMDIDRGTIIVGASGYDEFNILDSGKCYIYTKENK